MATEQAAIDPSFAAKKEGFHIGDLDFTRHSGTDYSMGSAEAPFVEVADFSGKIITPEFLDSCIDAFLSD